MKTRKILALVVALSMVLTFIPAIPAFADYSDDNDAAIGAGSVPAAIEVVSGAKGIPATIANDGGGDFYGVTIDLYKGVLSGTINAEFKTAAFSVDGGTKWKAGSPQAKDIAKIASKGGTLWLADAFDTKAKKPAVGVAEVTEVTAVAKQDKYDIATNAAKAYSDYSANAAVTSVIIVEGNDLGNGSAGSFYIQGNYSTALAATAFANGTPAAGTFYTWVETKGVAAVAAVPAANIAKFAKVVAPAAADKPAVSYSKIAYDPDTAVTGFWDITKKDLKTSLDVMYVLAAADKKNPAEGASWALFDHATGVAVKPIGTDGKPVKDIYLVRTPAKVTTANGVDTYTAPGKIVKLAVQSVGKAPALKVDYKNEALKLKAGVRIDLGTGYGGAIAKDKVKTDALAKPQGLEEAISAGTSISVVIAPTDKKPASAVQTIKFAARAATITDATAAITVENGKAKLAKGYEVWDKTKNKWGGLKVDVTKDNDVIVRLKSTAKEKKGADPEGLAASEAVTITIVSGVINADAVQAGKDADPPRTVAEKKGAVSVNIKV